MERKFESELAEKVALRSKRGFSGRKASVFALAIISSAIMIGAAAITLSMKASAEDGTWINYSSIYGAEDYLVYDDSEEATFTELVYSDDPIYADDFVVKRTSDVKTAIFDTPGYGPTYTKIVYSVNVKLRHTAPFLDENDVIQIAGLPVSSLTVSGFDQIPVPVAMVISLNGFEIAVEGISVDTVFADGTISVDLVMPDLTGTGFEYTSYDSISFFVMLKVSQTGMNLVADEIGFPSYQSTTEE